MSLHGALSLGYFLFSAWLFSLQSVWLGAKRIRGSAVEDVPTQQDDPGQADSQRDLDFPLAMLAGFVGVFVAMAFSPKPYCALTASLLATLVSMMALGVGHWIPYAAAGVPLVWAHWQLWMLVETPQVVWTNAVVTIAITIGATLALSLFGHSGRVGSQRSLIAVEKFLHVLWLLTLQAAFFKTLDPHQYFLACSVISLAALLFSLLPALKNLTDFSFLPMLCCLFSLAWNEFLKLCKEIGYTRLSIRLDTDFLEAHWALWLATFIAFGYACAAAHIKRLGNNRAFLRESNAYQGLHILLAMGIGLYCFASVYKGENLVLCLGLASVIVALLSRWPGIRQALLLSDLYLI
ncbi:MAG TPA: hypothetical protein PKH07_20380, partial [bacterium]|nr:hypothetical protein [bacterium]